MIVNKQFSKIKKRRIKMLIPSLFIIGAIALLYFGAELSLDASEKLGRKMGMSPLAIGMLLIGFGTSLPEFFVGHIAGLQGKSGMAIGSLVGSNIANMFLILGISGLFATLSIRGKHLRDHLFIHLILGILLVFILQMASLTMVGGSILLALCAVYLFIIFKDMSKEKKQLAQLGLASENKIAVPEFNIPVAIVKMLIGFFMLYLGGEFLVRGGTDLCLVFGVSEYIISAIFIAFGTSFPELVTALVAAFKKKDTDIIVGNIVGSNLFNCAFILGTLGIYNFSIDQTFYLELAALLFGALFLVVFNLLHKDFSKKSGIVFIAGYIIMVCHWTSIF